MQSSDYTAKATATATASAPGCMYLVDSHAHLQLDPLHDHTEVALSNAASRHVIAIVVNAVCPGEDWRRVEALVAMTSGPDACSAPHGPLLIPQFGLHPWWIDKLDGSSTATVESVSALCNHLKEQLEHQMISFPMCGVGECGLDKCIKKRVSLEAQEAVLRCHIEVALKYRRPITLHCVGSWGRLFDILSEFADSPHLRLKANCDEKKVAVETETISDENIVAEVSDLEFCVVLHSCNAMPPDMQVRFQTLKNIALYYSFNGKQLEAPVTKLLESIPRDKLLIETDSPDMMPPQDACTSFGTSCNEDQDTEVIQKNYISTSLNYSCNEPANIFRTCMRVSALLGESCTDIAMETTRNALFAFRGTTNLTQ